jgi:hypothetical protein
VDASPAAAKTVACTDFTNVDIRARTIRSAAPLDFGPAIGGKPAGAWL